MGVPTSLNLPPTMTQEMDAFLTASGDYANRSELVRQAWRTFLEHQPEATRVAAAVELYKARKVTVSRAAEIADVSFDRMYEVLGKEGILDVGHADPHLAVRRAKEIASRFPRAKKV